MSLQWENLSYSTISNLIWGELNFLFFKYKKINKSKYPQIVIRVTLDDKANINLSINSSFLAV